MVNGIVMFQGTLEFHEIANSSMNVAIYDISDWTDFRCLVMKTAMRLVLFVCRQDVKTTLMNIKPTLVAKSSMYST